MKFSLYVPTFVVALLFMSGLRADASSFANTTSISIRDTNTAVPYPSAITVSGLTGTVATVTVTLHGLSHGSVSDIEMLLVGPTGRKFVFFSGAGGPHPISNLTLTFADGATQVPSTLSSSGTYSPTDDRSGPEVFAPPAPAVAGSDLAAPNGTETFAAQFSGTDPNGVWNLYIMDIVSGSSGSLANGWALNITINPPFSTVTTLQSSPNPSVDAPPSNLVALNAFVTSSSVPVPQGTVNFNEGTTSLATNVSLDVNGHAGYTNSTFTEGRHVITASYNGTITFAASTSTPLSQIVYTRSLTLTNLSIIPSKQFQFGFTGITMVTYFVLASTNLTKWSSLGPAIEQSPGQYHYTDSSISNVTRRFYRVQQP